MNIKTSLLSLLLVAICLQAEAGPIDIHQARRLAAQFLKSHHPEAQLERDTFSPTRKRMGGADAGTELPVYYVFNAADDAGFVVVSADDRTDAVLGYATRGRFDTSTMPPNVQAWMDAYAQQIVALDTYASGFQHEGEARAPIAPLLTTQWNQTAPFNDMCPWRGGSRTATGCVATAMAQVMKFHEWPAKETATIPAYTTYSAKISLPELAPTVFQWSDMHDVYEHADNATAVAELMRYCGQALQSDYDAHATGAYLADVPQVLTTFFNYDAGVKYLYQSNYPVSEWEDIIYAELQAERPVLHAGTSMGGGHAFVCDGYDGEGLFHFNWGWGGMYDGYFKLALLTPGTAATGAGTEDGFSYDQRIVTGIQPPAGMTSALQPFTSYGLQQSGTNLYAYFQNPNSNVATENVGFALVSEQGDILQVLKDCGRMTLKGFNLENNWAGLYLGAYGEVNLAPGVYRIAAICKPNAEGEWERAGSKQTYFEVEIGTDNELLSVVCHPIQHMEITSLECISGAVAGTKVKVRITIENMGDDLNAMLYFYASDTDNMGSPLTRIPLLLHGNTTSHYDVSFFPRNVGRYNMWLSNVDDGVSYIEKREIDVIAAPTQPAELELLSCTINPHDVSAEIEVRNNGTEPYYREIVAHIYEDLYGDGLYYYLKQVKQYGEIPPHTTRTYTFTFDGVTERRNCYINIGYYKNHTDEFSTQLGTSQYFKVDTTSVSATPMPQGCDGMIFKIDGTQVSRPVEKGIYIINGKKRLVK